MLCLKKGRGSCKNCPVVTWMSASLGMHIWLRYFLHFLVQEKITFSETRPTPQRDQSQSYCLENQTNVHVYDHFVTDGIYLYECERGTQWVKLSPNKCLIIFLFPFHKKTSKCSTLVETDTHRAPLRVCVWVVYEIFLRLVVTVWLLAKKWKEPPVHYKVNIVCTVRHTLLCEDACIGWKLWF